MIELIDRDSLYLFPRHTLSISTTIALVEILLIEIKIQNQKEVHPTTSITQVVVPSGPTEHMGIVGNYPHSHLANSLTLFQSQGADYPHCTVKACPHFLKNVPPGLGATSPVQRILGFRCQEI